MGNPVVHFELIGPDPARLRDFYSQLFGWDAPPGSPVAEAVSSTTEYSFISPSEQAPPAAGGIGGGPGYDSHAIFYVGVTNVAQALASAEALGAKTVLPPQRNEGGQVTVAHFRDPAGNLVEMRVNPSTVRDLLHRTGGIRPVPRRRWELRLSLAEREEISRGLAGGLSVRAIAAGLGRAPSTISREVLANGGRRRYRAARADAAAWARASRPKPVKLAARVALTDLVIDKLRLDWSPQQIAGWLRLEYPNDPEMQVSHETIYRSLFVQTRGGLRKELTAHLRTKRVTRRPAGKRQGDGRGGRPNILNISQRPAEATDRAVPGHWEGDLVLGRAMTPVATLVERSTRFLMLVALPEGHRAELVADALAAKITTLPGALTRTLTWDQGQEMAEHARFTIGTGIEVYFCDPKSPWQRGTNENTNGLLRQYLPRTVNMRAYSQADFDAIADRLNTRPRHTLGFKTPSQALAEVLR